MKSQIYLPSLLVLLILLQTTACKKIDTFRSTDLISPPVSLKIPIWETLQILDSALLTVQVPPSGGADSGALWCPLCQLYHTRAAEALFPFAYQYSVTGDTLLRDASIDLGNWLIRQQEMDGSWKETPEEWTGTSTDQLLMMALAYPLLLEDLSERERMSWLEAMSKAGNYLAEVMEPEFASINYVATTAASMAVLNRVVPDPVFARKAESMAKKVLAKMDDDYFITGEGGRELGVKYGVDLVYNLEMSLWGLALYARVTGDQAVLDRVKRSVDRHLHFIYPDGSMDGSWGIRSNKWTGYGGATSDGCQLLFSLLIDRDPAYRTAALRNLEFIEKCMKGGWVGYGPHHWEVLPYPPCIYPTFAKAKNLAMAHAFCIQDTGQAGILPSDKMGLDLFPTLDIATIRTENFYATVTNYGYKDPRGPDSKYMHRPTGGAISNLWLKDYGFLQSSSQTEYHRWEPMSFPEATGMKCLTSRIEFTDARGYFTNLYEFDASSLYRSWEDSITATIFGELKNRDQTSGGIGYSYHNIFRDRSVGKDVHLRFHDRLEVVSIIEPMIIQPGTRVTEEDARTVSINTDRGKVQLRILEGDASFSAGIDKDNYWSVYPALKAFPLVLTVKPDSLHRESQIYYEFQILPDEQYHPVGISLQSGRTGNSARSVSSPILWAAKIGGIF